MEEDFRTRPSVLADLGPLPEVVESNSETVWKMFLQLEAQLSASFSRTVPSRLAASGRAQQPRRGGDVCVDDAMAEARRFNRVCPVESEWLRLYAILSEHGGRDAPQVVQGGAFRTMPPLLKRMLVRDQVEWAAERGCLMEVYAFLQALPEESWTHMGD